MTRSFGFITSLIGTLLLALTVLGSTELAAQSISPQIVERLKTLPASQRNALLKQYGIDPSSLPGINNTALPERTLGAPGQPLERLNDETEQSFAFLEPQPSEEPVEEVAPEDKRFGLDLFRSDQSQFSLTDDSPVPDDYIIGIGDELQIYLLGKESATYTLPVERDGQIVVPGLIAVPIAGLRYEDARRFLIEQIESSKIGVNVSVTLARLRAVSVYVAGEVERPGTYSVSALTSATQLLFQVGGVSDIGSLRNIQINRSGKKIATLDLYDLLLRGDASSDVRLQSGDVVFIPPYRKEIKLYGAVKRPARYELIEGETLSDLIAMAGGVSADAYLRKISLVRSDPELGRTVTELSLSEASPVLRDGDEIQVREQTTELSNGIEVDGAVVRPGYYGWTQGLRVSDLLGNLERDYLKVADLNYAMIVRTVNRLRDIRVLPFKPIDAISSPGSEADPELRPQDRVLVFRLPAVEFELQSEGLDTELELLSLSEAELRKREKEKAEHEAEQRIGDRTLLLEPVIEKLRDQASPENPMSIASISGAVRVPGEYPLVANSDIADLIAAAGGLRDQAYLDAAELRRLRVAAGGGLSFSYESIDLRSPQELNGKLLSSRDHLTVRAIPDWNPTATVTISGEVRFPGAYRLERGERLADLIRRAGGFSDNAFPEGAMLTRESVALNERDRARDLAATIRQSVAASLLTEEVQGVSLAEISELTNELTNFEGQGRLLIDLPAAMGGDALANVRLLDGDELIIPQNLSNVTVVGEVKRQGTHSFQEGFDINDYLGLSAGLTARADADGLYVVRANGSVEVLEQSLWRFTKRNIDLRPGDTIVVPVNSRYKESLVAWREITQIIYQGAVSIAAVVAL